MRKLFTVFLFVLLLGTSITNIQGTYAAESVCDPNDDTCIEDDGSTDDGSTDIPDNCDTLGCDSTDENTTNDIPDYCNEPVGDDTSIDYSVCPTNDGSTDDGSTDDGSEIPYSYAVANSNYKRIEYVDGVWFGIIDITDLSLTANFSGKGALDSDPNYINVIGITLTRELTYLKSVQISFTTKDSCQGWLTLLGCIGSTTPSYEGVRTINNTNENDTFANVYFGSNDEEIVSSSELASGNDDYDYYLYVRDDAYDHIKVLELEFKLSAEEITNLKLDIQQQFNEEAQLIIDNPLLTEEERDAQIAALIEENNNLPDIDTETIFTAEPTCELDNCETDDQGPLPDSTNFLSEEWFNTIFDNFLDKLLSILFWILGGISIATIASVLAFIMVKGSLTLGWLAFVGTLRSIFKVSFYWGDIFLKGFAKVFGAIPKGIAAAFKK